jgi:glyoxylase-like metal-dependent hydrolase (beta-lactamase superfamily II)
MFEDGITAVDTEYVRPQMDAAHIVVSGGRAAVIDTGPNTAVPLILAALGQLQLAPDQVDYLFLTHVHLDHAGVER